MNQEIKAKWLKLLAKSKKARKMLRNKNTGGMCCMGVLCELYRRETGRGDWNPADAAGNAAVPFVYSTSTAPLEVLSWAGLTRLHQITLVQENDNQAGYPIKQIERL